MSARHHCRAGRVPGRDSGRPVPVQVPVPAPVNAPATLRAPVPAPVPVHVTLPVPALAFLPVPVSPSPRPCPSPSPCSCPAPAPVLSRGVRPGAGTALAEPRAVCACQVSWADPAARDGLSRQAGIPGVWLPRVGGYSVVLVRRGTDKTVKPCLEILRPSSFPHAIFNSVLPDSPGHQVLEQNTLALQPFWQKMEQSISLPADKPGKPRNQLSSRPDARELDSQSAELQ
ncbi:protein tonB2-like [Pseudopipra pipra]|uniref:protein tonB2-like n=1 Tax=Pseudopipra pipra TaxID=415032 RepID=UPI0031398A35